MKFIFLFLLLFQLRLISQDLPPKKAYPLDVKQIHSGHSLTDPLFHPWPGQYRYMIHEILDGPWDNLGKSTMPGSPMFWRWDHEDELDPSSRYDISDWELLIITEGVPLPTDGGNPPQITPAKEYLSLYANNAWENGNNGEGAQTLLWTTWTNIDDSDGPWRQLLNEYELLWEEMMDYANSNLPPGAEPVYIVPGHRMMARIYDDIELGLVPGVNSLDQIFSDNIHMNDWGAYAVAMIHYACIYNQSPVGLPNSLFYDYALPDHNPPSEELARYFQNMVWEVVTSYERTGVREITNLEEFEQLEFTISPNPSSNWIHINYNFKENTLVQIVDISGNIVIETNKKMIDISELSNGLYFIFIDGNTEKLIVNK